jgi:glycerol dehydrogenase
VGGGKAVDTAKAVAWKLKVPSIVVGTQCATNADTSAESVVYTEDHKFVESLIFPRNPVVVIEDTEILCKAPPKFMVWGMGDALSTKFESAAFAQARRKRKDGAVPTGAALALADACYDSLMEHGLRAVRDLKNGIHSADVDDVIEAVKLASGMAFENTGCALAHALHNGLTKTGEVEGEHGEIVAYCTIVQMAYEKRPAEEVSKVADWCGQIGLPTRLEDIGNPSKGALRKAAEHASEKDPDSRNMPQNMKPKDLMEAIDRVESRSW